MAPISEHRLQNGWILREYEYRTESVFVGEARNAEGLARFTHTAFRCPSTREVRIFHHVGATTAERGEAMLIAAARIAVDRSTYLSGHWDRFRNPSWAPGKNVYRIILGSAVDVEGEFARLSREANIGHDIDRDFERIVESLRKEVSI